MTTTTHVSSSGTAVTIIEQVTPAFGPQPTRVASTVPPELQELCTSRTGPARIQQAKEILEYHQTMAKEINHIWRLLVFSMGFVRDELLYTEIGKIVGLEFVSIRDYWQYLQIPMEMVTSAANVYDKVLPYLESIHVSASDVITDQKHGELLLKMATATKQNRPHNDEPFTEEEIEQHQIAVESVKATGAYPSHLADQLFRTRHIDTLRHYVDLRYSIVTTGKNGETLNVPRVVIYTTELSFEQIEAAEVNQLTFHLVDANKNKVPWQMVREQLTATMKKTMDEFPF